MASLLRDRRKTHPALSEGRGSPMTRPPAGEERGAPLNPGDRQGQRKAPDPADSRDRLRRRLRGSVPPESRGALDEALSLAAGVSRRCPALHQAAVPARPHPGRSAQGAARRERDSGEGVAPARAPARRSLTRRVAPPKRLREMSRQHFWVPRAPDCTGRGLVEERSPRGDRQPKKIGGEGDCR